VTDAEPRPEPAAKSPIRFVKWVVIGALVAVALVYGAIFIYANVINDAPDALDEGDLSAALEATTVPSGTLDDGPDTTAAASVPAPTTEPTTDEGPAGSPGFDGDWLPTSASEFGYRVDEVLAGVNVTAVGRSNEIQGLLTIDGTAATTVEITVQVADITSDDSRRDGQFRGRIMNAEEFPTATFVLTEPIEFGELPLDGSQVVATATGELTLRGVTNTVTFDVTAEASNDRIGVLGSIPVVFADYGIANPSTATIKTEDDGLVEFVLVFERA
jgi:polyisoprenoid-binding protein YceI